MLYYNYVCHSDKNLLIILNLKYMFRGRLKWLATAVFVVGFFSFIVLASTVKAETSYYRNVYWMCQDGTETRDGGSAVCKGAEEWNKMAETACVNHCEKIYGKCGVAKYSVSTGCNLEVVIPKPSCKDTDGGNEIFTKGTLSVYTPDYGNQTVIEACADSKTMDELVCLVGDPTYAYTHKKTECPYGCKEGACLATAPVSNTKADLGLYGFLQVGKNKREVKWNETITLTQDDMLWISGGKVAFDLYYADKNYGNAKSGMYSNKIYFDNSLVSQQTSRQLDIGEKQDVWTQAYFSTANGVHALKFKVDADNQVAESSETNNEFVVYIKLSGFTSADSGVAPTTPTTPSTPTAPTTPVATYDLNAKPTILTPTNNDVLKNYPRKTDVRWTEITSASKYELEVACDYCGSSLWSSVNSWGATTNYFITPALAGDNQFRAKVKAIYPDGRSSQWSDYVYFRYNTSQYVAPTTATSGGQSTTVAPAPMVKPATPVKKPIGKMLCGNSEGGDGLYSACVNNTIKHHSKMNVKVRTYNNYYVWLTLSNADKKYYRVPVRKSLEIDRADGEMSIKITYTKRSAKYGVFLQVETTFDASEINPEEDVIVDEEVTATTPTVTWTMLPAYDETKVSVGFGVSVNDYPDHKDYTKSKNLANAFVNVYTVILGDNGTFRVLSYETVGTGTGDNPAVKVVVKSGQMVYFEGFKTEVAAKAGATKKLAQTWTMPPYKNFSSVNGKLCQTNYSKTSEFLGGTADYACAMSLSTPYLN